MTATVEQLTSFIESRFPVGESTRSYLSVTGEPYVVVGHQPDHIPTIPGVVDEGFPREVAFDEETACMSARSAFEAYAEGRRGVLYWRTKPSFEWDPSKKKRGQCCLVYMRLLISDKPRIS